MPTFILGAGFNLDTAAEAGFHQAAFGYPLVNDLLGLFKLSELPEGKSIEDLFSDSLKNGHYDGSHPISQFADRLRRADYYVARTLASAAQGSCYQQFFRAFPDSNFLTFDYDSLPETFLLRLGRWFPGDGYGVTVEAHPCPGQEEFSVKKSTALVLHLHGTLCIRTSEYAQQSEPGTAMQWLTERAEPRYFFAPSSIAANFVPFLRLRRRG